MKKLTALREHLLARIPKLKANPERLLTFIDSGDIEFHRGTNLSHHYRIPVTIVLTDYSGEIDLVVLPLLQWLNHYQPDLKPAEAVKFQAELLSNNAWDLSFEVVLTERVVATVDCDAGRINLEHRMPEFPLDPCCSANWELWMRQADVDTDYVLIAEWERISPVV